LKEADITFVKVLRGRIQTFPDWQPGARTANGTVLCHEVQLYRYSLSQCNELCRHNPLCCFSTSVRCCVFRYRFSPETFGYTVVFQRLPEVAEGSHEIISQDSTFPPEIRDRDLPNSEEALKPLE